MHMRQPKHSLVSFGVFALLMSAAGLMKYSHAQAATRSVIVNDSTQAKIARAEFAGPEDIARSARIIDTDASGNTRVLRQGSNGFTCMPGNPEVVKSGRFIAPVSVVSRLTQPADVLWITVKATDLGIAIESIPSAVPVGVVVPLLNGLAHIPQLRDRFGNGRVVPATITVEAEKVAPGNVVRRSPFARLNISSSGRAEIPGDRS